MHVQFVLRILTVKITKKPDCLLKNRTRGNHIICSNTDYLLSMGRRRILNETFVVYPEVWHFSWKLFSQQTYDPPTCRSIIHNNHVISEAGIVSWMQRDRCTNRLLQRKLQGIFVSVYVSTTNDINKSYLIPANEAIF